MECLHNFWGRSLSFQAWEDLLKFDTTAGYSYILQTAFSDLQRNWWGTTPFLCSTVYSLPAIGRTRTLVGWCGILSVINTDGSIPTLKTLPGKPMWPEGSGVQTMHLHSGIRYRQHLALITSYITICCSALITAGTKLWKWEFAVFDLSSFQIQYQKL